MSELKGKSINISGKRFLVTEHTQIAGEELLVLRTKADTSGLDEDTDAVREKVEFSYDFLGIQMTAFGPVATLQDLGYESHKHVKFPKVLRNIMEEGIDEDEILSSTGRKSITLAIGLYDEEADGTQPIPIRTQPLKIFGYTDSTLEFVKAIDPKTNRELPDAETDDIVHALLIAAQLHYAQEAFDKIENKFGKTKRRVEVMDASDDSDDSDSEMDDFERKLREFANGLGKEVHVKSVGIDDIEGLLNQLKSSPAASSRRGPKSNNELGDISKEDINAAISTIMERLMKSRR